MVQHREGNGMKPKNSNKKPSYLRLLWRHEPGARIIMILIGVAASLAVTHCAFNAAVVYEDWRCLTAECRLLKAGDKEMVLIGDSL